MNQIPRNKITTKSKIDKSKHKYYVYGLIYPNGQVFYIGKGSKYRIFQHEKDFSLNNKFKEDVITSIKVNKHQVKYIIYKWFNNEKNAYKYENYLISVVGRQNLGTGPLVNLVGGDEFEQKQIKVKKTNNRKVKKTQLITGSVNGITKKKISKKIGTTISKIKQVKVKIKSKIKYKKSLMEQCPKFDKCSAPICPLDKDKHLRVYYKGEPVCQIDKEEVII